MDILYLAHCVPWPPDKGDRIRAFNSVRELVKHHRVHLACLARSDSEAAVQSDLRDRCASVRIEVLHPRRAFVRGFVRFAAGECFTTSFYWNAALQAHVQSVVAHVPIGAVVLLSSAMALYAPPAIPFIADWGDVDSEKRLQYARTRFPGFAQRVEAWRLRKVERDYAMRSRRTFLTTLNELELFQSFAPNAPAGCAGNGIDVDFFNPSAIIDVPPGLRDRKFLVFVGMLNYFPNSDGVCWFAENIFPELRRRDPGLELLLVGRNPTRRVMQLDQKEGVTVTGAVDDVRPYLAAARAVVVPLRIARGIQNKVLEALAMGKQVLASEETCRTFMPDIPKGIVRCRSTGDYIDAIAALPPTSTADMAIANEARTRFTWADGLAPLVAELASIEREHKSRTTPSETEEHVR